MAFEWKRTPIFFSDIDAYPSIGAQVTMNPPLAAYSNDYEFFAQDSYTVPGGISRWRFELERLAGIGIVGSVFVAELRITRSSNPEKEEWHQREWYTRYDENGELLAESDDWELYQTKNFYTTHLTTTFHVDNRISGTYRLKFKIFVDDVQQGQTVTVGTFDLRDFFIENIRTKCPFDPMEGPGLVKFDLYCYPAPSPDCVFPSGWHPSSVDFKFSCRDLYGVELSPTTIMSTSTSAPDSDGLVASPEFTFDGIDSNGDFLEAPVNSIITTLTANSQFKRANNGRLLIFHRNCSCKQPVLEVSHSETLGMQYSGLLSCRAPSSLGYGWSGPGSARITEPSAGAVVYRTEGGHIYRWHDDGNGNYLPLRPDNYIELTKDSNNADATYVLTFRNQSRREFNSNGKLVTERDRNNNTVTYDYTGNDLTSIVDSKGKSLYFFYGSRTDGQPELIRIDDPVNGRATSLSYYSSDGRLQSITDPAGQTTEYTYDSLGRMTSRTEVWPVRGNRTVSYGYDGKSPEFSFENLYDVLRRVSSGGYDFASGWVGGTTLYEIVDGEPVDASARNEQSGFDFIGRTVSTGVNINVYEAS